MPWAFPGHAIWVCDGLEMEPFSHEYSMPRAFPGHDIWVWDGLSWAPLAQVRWAPVWVRGSGVATMSWYDCAQVDCAHGVVSLQAPPKPRWRLRNMTTGRRLPPKPRWRLQNMKLPRLLPHDLQSSAA